MSMPPPPGQWGPSDPSNSAPESLAPQPAEVGPAAPRARKRRTGLWIGAGVTAAVLAGAGTWGAMWYFSTGAQPSEALPTSTLAYVSVDLDPSGEQKIEALQMLRKFPAIEKELNLDSRDDLRPLIFEQMMPSECDLDYQKTVEPWLGERFAVAAVDLGREEPVVAVVAQVSDEQKARDGVQAMAACGNPETGAESVDDMVAFSGDWMVIAEHQGDAATIRDAAEKSPLADDDTHKKWIEEAGGAGILHVYAAPAAGELLAENVDEVVDGTVGSVDSLTGEESASSSTASLTAYSADDYTADDFTDPDLDDFTGEDGLEHDPSDHQDPAEQAALEAMRNQLREFEGGAITVRFNDGSLELEMAGGWPDAETYNASDNAARIMRDLPADTTAAVGISVPPGYIQQLMDQVDHLTNGEFDSQDIKETAAEYGMDFPRDLETVLGKGLVFSLGDFNLAEFNNASGPQDVPVGLIIDSPKAEVQDVLDRLLATAPAGDRAEIEPYVQLAGEEQTVLAPSAPYRDQLLKPGGLGDSDVFRSVIDDDSAQMLAYLNADQLIEGLDSELDSEDPEVRENLEPLRAFGFTASQTDGTMHVKFALSTD